MSITSTDIITRYDIFFGRKFNQQVEGSGSGIIIGQSDSSILIVTNNHVVDNAEEIKVEFIDEYKANAVIKERTQAVTCLIGGFYRDLPEDTLNAIKVARLGDSDKLKQERWLLPLAMRLAMDSLLLLVMSALLIGRLPTKCYS